MAWGTSGARGSALIWEVVGLASVFERVRSIVIERLGVDDDKVTPEAEFIGDLNADSLDIVEVVMALEQEFELEIQDDEVESMRTVGDAVSYIEERIG
jgi:acyl carrier protein